MGSNDDQSLARDMCQTSDEPNCDRKFKYNYIFEFLCICIIYIIYLRTLHAHLHTTPADTVHTPHTDEWLVASEIVSMVFGMANVGFFHLVLKFSFSPSVEIAILAVFLICLVFFFFLFQSTWYIFFLYKNVTLGSVLIQIVFLFN